MRRSLSILLLILALCLCLAPAAGAKAPLEKNGTPGYAAVKLSPELLDLSNSTVTLPTGPDRKELIGRMQNDGQYRTAGATVRGAGCLLYTSDAADE